MSVGNRRYIQGCLLALCLGLAGCLGGAQVDVMIQESPRGAVYLERIPDRQFQAAHPVRLTTDLVQRALQGVAVRDRGGLLQSLGSGPEPVVAAFSAEDVAFLAPAVAEALTHAAADQQVGFRVRQTGVPGYGQRTGAGVGSSEPPLSLTPQETTSGSLFVYGRSIYVTLSEIRHRAERPDTVNMPNRRLPDQTGLLQREVLFVPESVLRPDQYTPAFAAEGGRKTLVLDQERLAATSLVPTTAPVSSPATNRERSPGVQPTTVPQPVPGGDLQQIKDEMKKKETELEELRKELQDIKRQLGEQSRERAAPAR